MRYSAVDDLPDYSSSGMASGGGMGTGDSLHAGSGAPDPLAASLGASMDIDATLASSLASSFRSSLCIATPQAMRVSVKRVSPLRLRVV